MPLLTNKSWYAENMCDCKRFEPFVRVDNKDICYLCYMELLMKRHPKRVDHYQYMKEEYSAKRKAKTGNNQ